MLTTCPSSSQMKLHTSFANSGVASSARAMSIFRMIRADAMQAMVQHAPPDLRWSIDFDELQKLLASERESASAPDGSPCSWYRSAGGIVARFLFASYQACPQGPSLPVGFGDNRTVFIPKSSVVDAHGMVILLARLKRCALSLYATVSVKLLQLPCAMAYECVLSSAFTLRRDASPNVL